MALTITCSGCSKMCSVDDKYAGMQVRCPHCSNVISVPAAGAPAAPPPPAAAPAPPPPGPRADYDERDRGYDRGYERGPAPAAAGTPMQVLGLTQLETILFFVAAGCLGMVFLSILLPWISVGFASRLGITIWQGILIFLLVMGTIGYTAAAFFMKNKFLFTIALWVLFGVLCFSLLLELIFIIQAGSFAGIGFYIALLFTLGAGGTGGFVTFSYNLKKR